MKELEAALKQAGSGRGCENEKPVQVIKAHAYITIITITHVYNIFIISIIIIKDQC